MGYTHYWTQKRDYSAADWAQLIEDVSTLLTFIEHGQDVRLCDGEGNRGTRPVLTAETISFNGSGDDAHETFYIERKRTKEPWQSVAGSNFCKTARKPYDLAVTAALCYLGAVTGDDGKSRFDVISDGSGSDWLRGLEAARMALPRYANVLDIPRGILEADRWCAPWPSIRTETYMLACCVDGHAYAIRHKDGACYRFETHREMAEWAERYIEPVSRGPYGYDNGGRSIFNASGSFDKRRMDALARAQSRALGELIRYAPVLGRDIPPPAYVRPGEMPPIEAHYSFADLLAGKVA